MNKFRIIVVLCVALGAGGGAEVAPRQQAKLRLLRHLPMPLRRIPPAPAHELSVGSSPAAKGQFPFIVSLQINGHHHCGGAIITHHTVLSAAHCMKYLPSSYSVVAGDHDLKIEEGTEQYRKVAKYVIHPDFKRSTRLGIGQNDVAILFLTAPFVFGDYVKPIKLAAPGVIHEGSTVLSGWGVTDGVLNTRPDVLMTLEIPLVNHTMCLELIGRRIVGMDENELPDSILCTVSLTGDVGPCPGDSGGPLVQNGVLVGVVSWGPRFCGTADIPSGFTRVSAFTEWILVADRQLRAQQSSDLVHTLERNLPPGFPAPPRARLFPALGPATGANHNPPFKGLR